MKSGGDSPKSKHSWSNSSVVYLAAGYQLILGPSSQYTAEKAAVKGAVGGLHSLPSALHRAALSTVTIGILGAVSQSIPPARQTIEE